jgi:hypothetical protein
LLALALAPASAAVAARPIVKVGQIESDSDCSVYESYWGYWLVLECRQQFSQLREGIQSALVETGVMNLSTTRNGVDTPRPDLIVTGRVQGLGSERSKASASDYCVATTRVKGSLELRVRDALTNRVVHAATITRSVEVGHDMVGGASDCSTGRASRGDYDLLQRDLALTAARTLAFRIKPMRVVASDGRNVTLDYGAPLLVLGTVVQVRTDSGMPAKYRVVSAMGGQSYASPMGMAAPVSAGAAADVIDGDDPAANGRRFERVEL